MNDNFLNLLGICRKAGKLSLGHDASFESISKNKAKLCLLSLDASDRLKNEFAKSATFEDRKIKVIQTKYPMAEYQLAVGRKVAVMTINDKGFASKLTELYKELHGEEIV